MSIKRFLVVGLLCVFMSNLHAEDSARVRYLLSRVWFVFDKELDCILVEPIDDLAPLPPLQYEADGQRVRIPVDDDNYAWYSLPFATGTVEAIDAKQVITGLKDKQSATNGHILSAPLRDMIKALDGMPSSDPSLAKTKDWRYVRDNRMIDEGDVEEIRQMLGIYLSDLHLDLIPLLSKGLENARIALDIAGVKGTGLEAIAKMTAIHWLYADGKDVKSAAPLAGLTNMISLNLNNNKLTDVRAMSGMKALERARLADNDISNLSPLSGLPALKGLDASGNVLRDLESLRGASGLEWLNLAENKLSNIDGLSVLQQLRSLNLNGCGLSDLGPVAKLTRLNRLQFAHNEVTSLSPLAGLANLEYIIAPGNQVDDLTSASSLVKLRGLDFSDNKIRDIAPLEKLIGLEFVNLANNEIESIGVMSKFKILQNLYLSGNKISDIGALKSCSQLTHADLSANDIEDISALENLQRLSTLYLYENKIADLAPLVRNAEKGGIGEGATIWLTGNPLGKDAVNQQIPLLRTKYKITILF